MTVAVPHPLDGNPETAWMPTYTGRRVYPLALTPDQVCLKDVAHHLATTNRWGGAADCPVSVARHSLNVAFLLPLHMQLIGLLHDAAEYVLGDVVRPVKACFPEYKLYERRALQAIFDAFGVEADAENLPSEVHHADNVALAWEYRDFMDLPGVPWPQDILDFLPHVPNRKLVHTHWARDAMDFLEAITLLRGRKE